MNDLTIPVGKQDHIRGNPKAQVMLLEYGDFECPYCGRSYGIIKEIRKQAGSALAFAFRNFPLSEEHPHAKQAAYAAEAAGLQGKFWEMHDLLYEHQDALTDEDLESYAKELELNIKQFDEDMNSSKVHDRVQQDFLSGVESGVNGTPTFFINGERYDEPVDTESLLSAILSQDGGYTNV